jgi:hypothetical protein
MEDIKTNDLKDQIGPGKLQVLLDWGTYETFDEMFWKMVQDFIDGEIDKGYIAPADNI